MKTIFNQIRIPLLEWYLVAATCYFMMIGLDQPILVVAIVLGFVHTYILDPIVYALQPDPAYEQVEATPSTEELKKVEEVERARNAKKVNQSGNGKKKQKAKWKRENITMTQVELERPLPMVWKEIFKAIIVCGMIFGCYYLVNTYIYVDEMKAVDAFTFGALYWIFNKIWGKLIKKWNG